VSGSVALIGFMGAGKTRIGRLVARELGVSFVDTDDVIVRTHGPIAELFATRGEPAFRELERAVVLSELDAAQRETRVVALGGGAVTIDAVREVLRRLPHVVWLDAPPHILYRRAQSGTRPLATSEALFEALYADRLPFYRDAATVVVRTTGRERAAWVADQVIAAAREER